MIWCGCERRHSWRHLYLGVTRPTHKTTRTHIKTWMATNDKWRFLLLWFFAHLNSSVAVVCLCVCYRLVNRFYYYCIIRKPMPTDAGHGLCAKTAIHSTEHLTLSRAFASQKSTCFLQLHTTNVSCLWRDYNVFCMLQYFSVVLNNVPRSMWNPHVHPQSDFIHLRRS